jgi:hypothetical protein
MRMIGNQLADAIVSKQTETTLKLLDVMKRHPRAIPDDVREHILDLASIVGLANVVQTLAPDASDHVKYRAWRLADAMGNASIRALFEGR